MYRILLIEDDKNIREAMMSAAQVMGVVADVVADGDIAKGKADEACIPGKYDAVVVGGYFQEAFIQNGHQIVERLHRRDRKVIIVGTAGDPRREADFRKAGATEFVLRGSQNRPAAGVLMALELLKQRDEKKRPKKAKATPDPE